MEEDDFGTTAEVTMNLEILEAALANLVMLEDSDSLLSPKESRLVNDMWELWLNVTGTEPGDNLDSILSGDN